MEEAIILGTFNFLGYNLLTRLLNDGVIVHGLDVEYKQQPDDMKEEKLLAIGRNANLHYIEGTEWCHYLRDEKCRGANILFYCLDAVDEKGEAVRARDCLIEAIQYCQSTSTTLIFASSIEVVNHRKEKVITEETPILPLNKRGKRYAEFENMIKKKCLEINFPYLILRFPTLYGPWQPNRFAYQHSLLQLGGETCWDEYKEDVLYIDEAVDALVKAGISEARSETIHIVTGREDEWRKGMAYIKKEHIDQRERDIVQLSNKKANEILSFSPSISIEEGIEKQKEFNRIIMRGNGSI